MLSCFGVTVFHAFVGFFLNWVATKLGLVHGYEVAMVYWLTLVFFSQIVITGLRADLFDIYGKLVVLIQTIEKKGQTNEVSKQETP